MLPPQVRIIQGDGPRGGCNVLTARFQAIRDEQLPFLQRFEKQMQQYKRQRWGIRYLKPHERAWLVSSRTLRQQIGVSLVDRCRQFQKEFPVGHMNPTLLKKVYDQHRIKRRALRWYKVPKGQDPEKVKQ